MPNDNRTVFSWFFDRWNYGDLADFLLENYTSIRKKYTELDDDEKRKIAHMFIENDRGKLEWILDELGV